jgi:hypothetical protein
VSAGFPRRDVRMTPGLAFFVALETRVWQALADGDAAADLALLDPAFVGVYASGFAGRGEHAAPLPDGPAVGSFAIEDARLLALAERTVLLAYRATFTRPGAAEPVQTMFVSSVWVERGGEWRNVFSQDTAAG